MRNSTKVAVLAAVVMLWTGSSTTVVSAAPRNVQSTMRADVSTATDISARRRHYHHFRYVRQYRPAFAFYHRTTYRPYYRPYYRSYPAFATYRPFYRPYHRRWYRPWYAYYRPAYYSPWYEPYYGPRTFVSIGPFGFGFGGIF
jgi:hypothetical protein